MSLMLKQTSIDIIATESSESLMLSEAALTIHNGKAVSHQASRPTPSDIAAGH
jgi:hypothetical protein